MSQYDWEDDFSHENGNYECHCCICGRTFIGHKRRVTCKACDNRYLKDKLILDARAIDGYLVTPVDVIGKV